jgi:hypothetical protein
MTKENTGLMYWGYLFSDHEIYPIGWYDMTDWVKGWDKLFADVMQMADDMGIEPVHAIRGDCIAELIMDLEVLQKHRKKRPKLPYQGAKND